MRVFVVDNGGQWTHREWRVLKYLKVDTKIVPNTTPFEDFAGVDALVLSGGAPRVASELGRMGRLGEYLDKADFPILAICAGMHFMANHYGGATGAAKLPEFGKTTLMVDDEDEVFRGLPKQFTVWGSHNDEITVLPKNFRVLAHSPSCLYEAIEVVDKPFYALQFHPEVENTEHGYEIFTNFLNVVEGWKR
jgi:GMP synthase (glutamine-hydrolysing)